MSDAILLDAASLLHLLTGWEVSVPSSAPCVSILQEKEQWMWQQRPAGEASQSCWLAALPSSSHDVICLKPLLMAGLWLRKLHGSLLPWERQFLPRVCHREVVWFKCSVLRCLLLLAEDGAVTTLGCYMPKGTFLCPVCTCTGGRCKFGVWECAGGKQPLLACTLAVINVIKSLVVRSFPGLTGGVLCVVSWGQAWR